MALHSGMLWLADGFERYDKLAASAADNRYDKVEVGGAGDARCPVNASHKLMVPNNSSQGMRSSHCRPQRPSSAQTSRSKAAAAPRPKSARLTNCNCPTKARVGSRAPLMISPPVDPTPRAGAWASGRTKDYADCKGHDVAKAPYDDLPTHPDLRYFDRHSRCYNYPHCADTLVSTRPKTACSARRMSLTQCECCGEVTSMIRYRYAPTGSAMTEMNARNKTFLYPEKLLSYDSYTGRRRPASAPSGATRRRPPNHNYVIRGDIPHFCNFVKPCSVYDKLSGRKVMENTDVILDLLSSYDYTESHHQKEEIPIVNAQDGLEMPGVDEQAFAEQRPSLHRNVTNNVSDTHLGDTITNIRSERISVVSIGDTRHKRQSASSRKRPPSLKKQTSKPKIMSKSIKKKGLLDEDSSATLLSTPADPVSASEEVDYSEAVTVEQPPVTAMEEQQQEPDQADTALPSQPSPEAKTESQHIKPKYTRKVGSGSQEDDHLADFDATTRTPLRMQAWMNGRLALSKRSSRFELPMDMRALETMTPLQYLSRYCVVTSKRQMLYDKIFMKQRSSQSGKLGYQELQKALSEVLVQSIDKQKMQLVMEMLLVDETVQIDKKLFHGVSAFAERLLYPIFARGDQFTADTQKEKIETADFFALEWKFHGVNVSPSIRSILETL